MGWIIAPLFVLANHLSSAHREEAYAKTKLDYSMFTKILSPVQSAWFITEAYPLKFDCQALASAVCHIWSHMCAAPAVLPPQLQQPPAARQQLTQLLQQQQQQRQQQQQQQQQQQRQQQQQQQQQRPAVRQMRTVSPARRPEPAQAAAAMPFRREALPATLEALQATQPEAARPLGMLPSRPAVVNLSAIPLHQQLQAAQVPQHAQQSRALQMSAAQHAQHAQHAQRAQHQRPLLSMEQGPVPQRSQYAQEAQAPPLTPTAQRVQQLQSRLTMAEPSGIQQATQPPFSSLSLQQQVEEMENWQRRQFLQQRLGVPAAQVLPSGQDLHGLRSSSLNSILSGQRYMGLGALQAPDSVLAGAVPRPTGARLPMAVP